MFENCLLKEIPAYDERFDLYYKRFSIYIYVHQGLCEPVGVLFAGPLLCRRDSIAIQRLVINKLREIMQLVDLEEVTSKQIRMQLEEETQLDLTKFRNFIDQTILMICGQMEKPSKIKDYLYLVSYD